jgi:hypothetical protein
MSAFVARISDLTGEANGWQAFFLNFLKLFLRFGTADYADVADKVLINAADEIRTRSPTFPTANR